MQILVYYDKKMYLCSKSRNKTTSMDTIRHIFGILINVLWIGFLIAVCLLIIYQSLKQYIIDNYRKKINDNERTKDEDEKRKEFIKKRVYSYKYENVIYEIFSPYARKGGGSGIFRRQSWTIGIDLYLEDEFVKNEISRILNIPYSDAATLFEEFLDNELLMHSFGMTKCCIGHILTEQWDIITQNDNNFSIWMESHPDIESKDSADRRRDKYNLIRTIPFYEFIDTHGKYSIENPLIKSYNTYFLMFDDGTRVRAYLPDIEIDNKNEYNKKIYLSHDYLLNEIQSMSDLFVRIDDNQYNLIKLEL